MELSRRSRDKARIDHGPLEDTNLQQQTTQRNRPKSTRRVVSLFTLIVAMLACSVTAYWRLFVWQPAVVDPFSSNVLASVQFPLYYPTQLPTGFRIDKNSVQEPQAGVVIFDLIGQDNIKLYVSEEARSSKFDLSDFYSHFTGLKEYPVSDGSIAVGTLNNGLMHVVSRANDTTWVLANTRSSVTSNQLVAMLKSLKHSY